MGTRTKNRVGFTGHQSLSAKATRLVRATVAEFLADHLPLAGVTSLAAGSDQIFAECVLKLGGELRVIVPSKNYEDSFSERSALENYRRLLARAANAVVLNHDAPDEAAYWQAGQMVVVQSDLLIAVWDGQPAAGLGGTADVVRYARQLDRPVTIIWPEGASRGQSDER